MDKRTSSINMRVPEKLDQMVELFARESGRRKTDAWIWLVSFGLHNHKSEKSFHIEDYTENFFESIA